MYIKYLVLSLFALSIITLLSCNKDEQNEPETTGIMKFNVTTWNAQNTKSGKGVHTCEIIDIRHFIKRIDISTDPVEEGGDVDAITWTKMYESTEEMLHTEREVTITLPAGKYQSMKITQRNRLYWVCTLDGETFEFPDLNYGDLVDDDAMGVNYFGEAGLFLDVQGVFSKTMNDEKIGMVEIKSGKTTYLTMRLNFTTLEWADIDNSGDWTPGDKIDNWGLPDGIDTMTDFIVEYE